MTAAHGYKSHSEAPYHSYDNMITKAKNITPREFDQITKSMDVYANTGEWEYLDIDTSDFIEPGAAKTEDNADGGLKVEGGHDDDAVEASSVKAENEEQDVTIETLESSSAKDEEELPDGSTVVDVTGKATKIVIEDSESDHDLSPTTPTSTRKKGAKIMVTAAETIDTPDKKAELAAIEAIVGKEKRNFAAGVGSLEDTPSPSKSTKAKRRADIAIHGSPLKHMRIA